MTCWCYEKSKFCAFSSGIKCTLKRCLDEGITQDDMNWRNKPITEKQKKLIEYIMEFSPYNPLPPFKGTTRDEASDYIDKHGKDAFDDVNSKTYGY